MFYFDPSLRVAKRKIYYWSSSKFIFSKTNRKILKARHTLVAYRVLIEIVRFVWLCVVMRRRVIQQSEHVWFWVWSLARAKKAIINFKRSYIRILHFITFSVIYSLLEFYRKKTRLRKISRKAPQKVSSNLKDGAYYCYCAYVLRISRYSDFLLSMLTNTGIFLRGFKLSGESRS